MNDNYNLYDYIVNLINSSYSINGVNLTYGSTTFVDYLYQVVIGLIIALSYNYNCSNSYNNKVAIKDFNT